MAKPGSDFDAEAYLRATAPALGLDLKDTQITDSAVFLSIAHDMATILAEAPVPDNTLDLVSVFQAGDDKKAQ